MIPYYYLILLISLSAGLAYVNQRFIKLPFVIGLFFLSVVLSLVVIITKNFYAEPFLQIRDLVVQSDISSSVLNIFLGFLLFAGALHTNWFVLKNHLKNISVLAVGGVLFSTIFIAFVFHYVALLLGLDIPMLYCFIFGALISPTDPIAVLSILKEAKVPEKVEITIVGESLFNDGIGVVLFIALTEMIGVNAVGFDAGHFAWLFLQEAVGGVVFGLIIGYILHYLLSTIDHYETEVLLTLAFVMLGYFISSTLHISGALAMVIMGLMVGNFRKGQAMSDRTEEYVAKFWELVDVILNALLFILIALVLVVIDFDIKYLILGVLSVLILIFSRFLAVSVPRRLFPRLLDIRKDEAKVIIWGGLRGGLSLALVLSLPDNETRDILLVVTYIAVVFSILIQGITIGRFSKRVLREQ